MAKKGRAFAISILGFAVIAAVILYFFLSNKSQDNQKPVTGVSFLMDTVVEYKLYGDNAKQAGLAVEQALSTFEQQFSRYIEGSEIDQINRNAGGTPVVVSQDTFDLISRCVQFGESSGGLFDITIAPLTSEWNVTAEHPKVPSESKIIDLRALVNYHDLVLSKNNRSVALKQKGQAIDVGGVAKGFACGLARRTALEYGVTSGYVSIGGNVMVIGVKPDGTPFQFGIHNPRGNENEYIGIITLPDSTMATSGDYERYFEQDGVRYHHILDPRTGWPAKTDLISVSVISPDGAYADFMSTYLFIKGEAFVLEHLNVFDCGLVVVDQNRNVHVSENLKDHFTPSDASATYHFNEVGT